MSTTAAELRRHLATAEFPLARDEVVRAAVRSGADDVVIAVLRALPPVEYASFDEVLASAELHA
ncbi:MAG TPA: DUF2795 domain-containing protein [Acidimicrobiales bacterium]|nr:DUF2795 domain-containing protein [Acidimicrobiales bacterium]